ncbi:Podocin [Wickerhamomyces ciferrii]|uniref:Podocin n=1 Tax=Wickerhamomyces ciferrii (strain ATCC 14091 / BCRC 22168 / CBS 111 / JCM 3599 / NBRC 0793 / NRRL Y-1031 F-60-10) TaxID=1206466 RepID=K0KGJ1_WICCF|nr:Podocin [Wickerhamomyces ciferrii]CCH41292.1 Podocin [Wickerhamomyces ciferrii]
MSQDQYYDASPKVPQQSPFDQGELTYGQQQQQGGQHNTKIISRQPDAIKQITYAKEYNVKPQGAYQSIVSSLGSICGVCGICFLCPCKNPYNDVDQGSIGMITKFGELARVVDPGSTYVNIFSEKLHSVSIRIQVQDIPEQACLTKDNVIVYLKSVLYYNIIDPQKAVFGISNIQNAIVERTQTTLRDVIGSRVLQDVIERREEIAEAIQIIIAQTAAEWGVHVESILIKDLQLSNEVTQSLSQAAQAKRIGESKIITAKAEVESAKLMRQAADILASKPAMQIRYLDAMQNMAKSANSKVIFMPSSGEIDKAASNQIEAAAGSSKNLQEIDELDEFQEEKLQNLQKQLEQTRQSGGDQAERYKDMIAMKESLDH